MPTLRWLTFVGWASPTDASLRGQRRWAMPTLRWLTQRRAEYNFGRSSTSSLLCERCPSISSSPRVARRRPEARRVRPNVRCGADQTRIPFASRIPSPRSILFFARVPLRHSGRASLRASRVPMPARTEPRAPVHDVAAYSARSIFLRMTSAHASSPGRHNRGLTQSVIGV
jgi:hypothetical protein